MKPYYILETTNFNTQQEIFSSSDQGFINEDADFKSVDFKAGAAFKKDSIQNIDDILKYDLRVEVEENRKGRIYGMDKIFNKWIFIEEDKLYYSTANDIIILSSNKSSFDAFYNYMQSSANLLINKVYVDFDHIIRNRNSLGILSIWLRDIPNDINISSLGIHGNQIENSNQYNMLKDAGAETTNLSIRYEYEDKEHNIMITRHGGVILYEHLNDSDALPLVNDIYRNLFKQK